MVIIFYKYCYVFVLKYDYIFVIIIKREIIYFAFFMQEGGF